MTSEEEAPATVEQWADLDFEPIDSKTLEDIKPVSNDRWAETGKEMLPCDEAEAMLIAQMIETHELAMTFARRLKHVENIPQQDSAVNGLTKLTRTYAAQMASLKHYRTGGEQRVIVQRVDVREGGQAVVGVVNSGKGGVGPEQKRGQSHALTDARGAAVLCDVEAEQEAVPSSGGAGPADLPDARWN
jgi:hypothetical protein